MSGPQSDSELVNCDVRRLILASGTDFQHIYLGERDGPRLFSITIGNNEANEIHRVIHAGKTARPLTHQLASDLLHALGGRLNEVRIIDLKDNTFFAKLLVEGPNGEAIVDARPSDAIALALRSRAPIRVAESVLRTANENPDDADA